MDIALPVLDRVARDIEAIVGDPRHVRFGRHDRMLYATDASIYQVEPLGVVIPPTIDAAEQVIRYCLANNLPILPRGGGTSLAGQAVNRAIILDFSAHCGRVISIDSERMQAVVEPGVVLDELNRVAAADGLMFGPDVATSTHATLGGMIGNNSAGAHSILYGRTVEHLAGVDCLLADGTRVTFDVDAADRDERVAALTRGVVDIVTPLAEEIRRRYPTTTRRVNGYNLDLVLDQVQSGRVNLASLVCGSEGTLAVTLGATVGLVRVPARKTLAIIAAGDLDDALGLLGPIIETGPSAVELLDDVIISLAMRNVEYRRYVELLPTDGGAAPGAVLYVEYFGDDEDELRAKLADLGKCVEGHAMISYTDADAMAAAWKLRKAGEPLLHAMPGDRKPLTFIEDTAVDPARLPEFVREFRAIVESHGTTAAYYAHASVGCLHIRPMISLRDPEGRDAVQAIAEAVTELVKTYRGALSGEHGDGRARSPLLRRFYGDAICDAFASIKALFDPDNLLNPGNIVEPAAITDTLRVEPGGHPASMPDIKPFYRYDAEHGFGAAVEMCNGAGVCRKTTGGTMCPSYRALRDERHATRGRGNALRLAITGQLGPSRWDDAETIRTLDLCLSCKACKAECPSNVDIAKLKSEYTAQRFAAAGRVPMQVRAFAAVRGMNRLGSRLYPLANALTRFGPTAAIVKRAMGIDRRRSLPRFGPSLYRWHARRPVNADAPAVVLMGDCFTAWSEPHIGRSAVEVLEALGYRVVLPRTKCCGRPLISQGMLAEAQSVCRTTAGELAHAMKSNEAVALVGCEPSCISAITDDWLELDMGIDVEPLQALARRTSLVEQFIHERWEDHPTAPQPAAPGRETVLLHGHCHQKALWGVDSSAGLLRRLVGDRLEVPDTGCCGMAGAFGFTPGHYELSMAIGESDLLPAIRAEPQAIIAAPGTSCRHQIVDGTGRHAVHPIEIAASVLVGANP
ncbi:MAG: FAD-binding oxidoreductase [Planctomycetota bacterium]|nr:MAG: FAD-binding oxidoreductase [Planctomycetota bacterium]